MAVWYMADPSEEGRRAFLDFHRGFSGFRMERAVQDKEKKQADLYLQVDAYSGVLLRFFRVSGMHIPPENPEGAWIAGASLVREKDGSLIWYDCGELDWRDAKDRGKILRDACWIRAGKLVWAMTDAEGNPVELPEDRLDQTREDYAVTTHRHFAFVPYEEA